jgi:ribosomal protein L24
LKFKYFFILDAKGKRHIVVAQDEVQAKVIIEGVGVETVDLYELQPNTFKKAGFLISE